MSNTDKIMKLMTNNENNYHYSTLKFINCHYSKVSRGANAILGLYYHYFSLFVIIFLLNHYLSLLALNI